MTAACAGVMVNLPLPETGAAATLRRTACVRAMERTVSIMPNKQAETARVPCGGI